MENIKILKGLEADHFMHPGDKIAIEKLKGYSTFKKFMERLLLEGLEEDMYLSEDIGDVVDKLYLFISSQYLRNCGGGQAQLSRGFRQRKP